MLHTHTVGHFQRRDLTTCWAYKKTPHISLLQFSRGSRYCEYLILGLRPANERRRYFVMTSLIGLEIYRVMWDCTVLT